MDAVEELVRVRVPDRTVELRVHGVSGTPPQALLGAYPVLVEGDADAGFYRAHDAGASGGIVEAFSWGGLTSRRRITALWLLLAPLSMLNVAAWMTPAHSIQEGVGRARQARDAAMRIVSVLATVLIAAIGVQAAASVLGAMTADASVAPGAAAAVVLVAASVPVALQLLSRVGGQPDDRDRHDDPWGRRLTFRALGSAHLGIGLGAVAGIGALATGAGERAVVPAILGFGAVVSGALASLTVRVTGPDRGTRHADVALSSGAVAIGVAVVSVAASPRATGAAAGLTAAHFAIAVACVLALSVALFAESRMAVRAAAGHSVAFATLGLFMAFAGFGALSYGLLGITSAQSPRAFVEAPEPATMFRLVDFSAVVLTCAVLWVAARVVGHAAPLGAPGEKGVDAARRLRAAVASAPGHVRAAGLGMLVAAAVLVIAELVRVAFPDHAVLQRVTTLVTDPRSMVGAVGWIFVALLVWAVLRARPLLLAGAALALAAAVVVVRALVAGGLDVFAWLPVSPEATLWPQADTPWVAASAFTLLALVVAVFLPAAAVVWFIVSASGDRESRRGVGVLWDLTNFWPRLHHPWAPPPYTERAIPALEQRLRHLREDHPAHAIVLSCHSQGAVLGFPVMRRMLGLDGAERSTPRAEGAAASPGAPRLRLLTYGNLLGAHYQQLFPHLFDDDRLRSVAQAQPGTWIQLHRETDPLGHPIAALGDHSRLASHTPPRGVDHVLTHANYSYSPEFQAALDELGGARSAPEPPEETSPTS